MEHLVKHIKNSYPDLTKSQKAVASYVLEHFREIPFLNITAMAEKIGVSDTTIINFCLSLGFAGFGKFKKSITTQVHSELYSVTKFETRSGESSDQSILEIVLEQDIQNIQATLTYTENQKSFDTLVTWIGKAKKIYVLGFRSSAILAQLLTFNLRLQNRDVCAIFPGLGDYCDVFPQVTEKDLVIAFAFPRYSSGTILSMRHLKEKGVPVALVTDMQPSDALQYCELTLCCSINSNTFVDSFASCVSLLNAITAACASKRKAETRAYLTKLEQLWDDFSVYSK